MYKVVQANNQMIWKMDEGLSTQVQAKWATDDERVIKIGDLVWLMDESVRRHENKMAGVAEIFPRVEGAIRSASKKTADLPMEFFEDPNWS